MGLKMWVILAAADVRFYNLLHALIPENYLEQCLAHNEDYLSIIYHSCYQSHLGKSLTLKREDKDVPGKMR